MARAILRNRREGHPYELVRHLAAIVPLKVWLFDHDKSPLGHLWQFSLKWWLALVA